MKSFRFLLGPALIGLLFAYSGCSDPKDPEKTPAQQQNAKLAKAWVCTSAKLNNSEVGVGSLPNPNAAYKYAGTFKLTMVAATGTDATAGPTYTTAGRPAGSAGVKVTPWPASGSFTFGTDVSTTLIREDGMIITYTVSDTELSMSFVTPPGFVGYDGGRTENVQGNWVFTFGL